MAEYLAYDFDVFRIIPFRFIGFAAPMYDIIWYDGTEKEEDERKMLLPALVTTNYICLHAVYRTIGSLVEINQKGRICAGAYPIPPLAVAECIVGDLVATVVAPYVVAFLVHRLIRDVACAPLENGNPVKRFMPFGVSIASVFLLSPVVDHVSELLIRNVIHRVNPC